MPCCGVSRVSGRGICREHEVATLLEAATGKRRINRVFGTRPAAISRPAEKIQDSSATSRAAPPVVCLGFNPAH
jgi:hypothetical protein